VLSRFVTFNPTLFDGRSVLELGSGSGLAGMAAARVGGHLILSDNNTKVIENIQVNLRKNSIDLPVHNLDW
jgi:predicted nicotinamide N-methyase